MEITRGNGNAMHDDEILHVIGQIDTEYTGLQLSKKRNNVATHSNTFHKRFTPSSANGDSSN